MATNKISQIGIPDLPVAFANSEGGRGLLAAAVQYLKEHKGSTLKVVEWAAWRIDNGDITC